MKYDADYFELLDWQITEIMACAGDLNVSVFECCKYNPEVRERGAKLVDQIVALADSIRAKHIGIERDITGRNWFKK